MVDADAHESPYQTPANVPSSDEDDGRRRPRLKRWHGILWLIMICLFSYLAVQWVIDWETTRGRVAPSNRLVWNAFSIHTGPLAGVYYWDYGHQRPQIIPRTTRLLTSQHAQHHFVWCAIVFPVFVLLTFPSTGLFIGRVRLGWRILIGVAFVLGTGLWYFSAMVSIAMLS